MVLSLVLAFGISRGAQAASYPDPAQTPGEADPQITAHVLCSRSTKDVRHVTQATKREVLRRQGIPWSEHPKYEVDHFIPLCAGGLNTLKNLWAESYEPRPGAHEKDRLEVRLCSQICRGEISPAAAQDAIRKDWIRAYQNQYRLGVLK